MVPPQNANRTTPLRRITVEIEQRRVELRATWTRRHSVPSPSAASEQPSQPCPLCGAAWLLLHDAAPPGQSPKHTDLQTLLESLKLHVHGSPSGHLWICQNSFEHMKENI